MPDATRAAVKGLSGDDLRALGLEALVINVYHLLLRPGMEIIKKAGGAHKFMNWSGPLCSDSGGYQVYSLIHKNPRLGKITDDKVVFRSPFDGSLLALTPEKSIQIQFDLRADMIVCLDDCPPHDISAAEMEKSVARTIAWAKRCRAEYEKQLRKCGMISSPVIPSASLGTGLERAPHLRGEAIESPRPLLFGVIQGGANLSLRRKCAQALFDIGFSAKGGPSSGWDGLCLGARPVDAQGKFLTKIVSGVADLIPEDKLRFALGAGAPADIVKSVQSGWDIFDCVIPTREGRHGRLYGWRSLGRHSERSPAFAGRSEESHRLSTRSFATLRMTSSRFARDFSPINPNSRLIELRENSRAYLHHLFRIQEPQAGRLATLNNLEFYLDLMKTIRVAIRKDLL